VHSHPFPGPAELDGPPRSLRDWVVAVTGDVRRTSGTTPRRGLAVR